MTVIYYDFNNGFKKPSGEITLTIVKSDNLC